MGPACVRACVSARAETPCACVLQVWDSYFYLSVIFINQPCLQLESFSPSKRKKTLERWAFSFRFQRSSPRRWRADWLCCVSGTET